MTAPNLKTQPRDLVFSSREMLDLQFQSLLRQDLQGDHLLRFKVYTPGGFLYQEITVPFVSSAPPPDASERAARTRSGAATRAPASPPPRYVPGYPRPLPVQRLVPVVGDTRDAHAVRRDDAPAGGGHVDHPGRTVREMDGAGRTWTTSRALAARPSGSRFATRRGPKRPPFEEEKCR